jgi:hypothetical protein
MELLYASCGPGAISSDRPPDPKGWPTHCTRRDNRGRIGVRVDEVSNIEGQSLRPILAEWPRIISDAFSSTVYSVSRYETVPSL